MQKYAVDSADLIYTNMIQIESLIRILVKKEIITKEDYLEELKLVNKEQHQKARGMEQV